MAMLNVHTDGALAISNLSNAPNPIVAGTVAYFGMNSAPTGWLKANGAAVSRTAYAALFAAIGTTYGVGNGSTTFALPDLRGEFLRGWDDGRGVDSARGIGSLQDMDWKGLYVTNTGQNTYDYHHGEQYWGKSTTVYNGRTFAGSWSAPSAALGGRWDASEVRPRNVALLACIKF